MSFADACLVRMTETLNNPVLLTTDADFRIYRRHGRQIIPCGNTMSRVVARLKKADRSARIASMKGTPTDACLVYCLCVTVVGM